MILLRPNAKCTLVDKADLVGVEAKDDKKVELDEKIDADIASSHIATSADSTRPDGQFSEERIKFKADPIRAQVADVSCVLDP